MIKEEGAGSVDGLASMMSNRCSNWGLVRGLVGFQREEVEGF